MEFCDCDPVTGCHEGKHLNCVRHLLSCVQAVWQHMCLSYMTSIWMGNSKWRGLQTSFEFWYFLVVATGHISAGS